MNDRQENKLSMAKTVQLILTNNADVIATPAAFASTKTQLDNGIAAIEANGQAQVNNATGSAKDKNQAITIAIETAIALIGAAQSCARELNNNTLFESLNYTASGLKRLRSNALTETLSHIRDVLLANIDLFTDYGIAAKDITGFTAQIAAITSLQNAPRKAITDKKVATTALRAEFKNLDTILEKLDGLAANKKITDPDFFNAYTTARIIIDLKGRGNGKDDDSGVTQPTT